MSSRDFSFTIGTLGNKTAADQWSDNLTFDQENMARAATRSFQGGADLMSARGRANIGAGGFSKRWQNALRVEAYPNRKSGRISLSPVLQFWHKIQYAGIFEDGGKVTGKPLLWIPISGVPEKFGKGERLTPLTFERATGQDLIPFRNPNTGQLMLGVQIRVPKKGKLKLSLSRLRRGANVGGKGTLETVPIFVGIKTVDIPKKFDLTGVWDGVVSELPGLYVRNKEEG